MIARYLSAALLMFSISNLTFAQGYNGPAPVPEGSAPDPSAPAPAPNPRQWVAISAGVAPAGTQSANAIVATAVERWPSQKEADRKAMNDCYEKINDSSKCQLVDDFNRGCEYIAMGSSPVGGASWRVGKTPQEAYDNCHAANMDCQIPVFGNCADSSQTMDRSAIVKAPKVPFVIALAAGRSSDSEYIHISVASHPGLNKTDAESRAIALCQSRSPGVTCVAVGTFGRGCGYITHGKGDSYANFGIGTTAQQAYNYCMTRDGFTHQSISVDNMACETHTNGGCIP